MRSLARRARPCLLETLESRLLLSGTLLADSAADFSGTQGQNNWSYGYSVGRNDGFNAFPTYDSAQTYAAWHRQLNDANNAGYWVQLWANGGHPEGSTTSGGRTAEVDQAIRRWTSTVAGVVEISGTIASADTNPSGGGTQEHLYVDGADQGETDIAAGGASGSVSYSYQVPVHVGSTVDLAIGPGVSGVDYNDSTTFTAQIQQVTVDALADTNNDGSITSSDEQDKSDPSKPGKVIIADQLDFTGDDIPGFADGISINKGANLVNSFAPLKVTLSDNINTSANTSSAKIEFDYDGADPASVVGSGTGLQANYAADSHKLRIWNVNGDTSRNSSGFTNGGNYITPSTPIKVSDLFAKRGPRRHLLR